MTVRAEHSGKDTAIADIVRLVEQAQARTAPIQRLADTVSGKFAYGVMGLSAATLLFWSTVRRRRPPVCCGAAACSGGGGRAALCANPWPAPLVLSAKAPLCQRGSGPLGGRLCS
jgi:hypothetical protein